MKRISVPLMTLALTLALGACKGEQKPAQDARAAGEILPGSASDAMIPYDTVRSQPPLAPKPVSSGKPGSGKGEAEDEADAGAEDAGTAETPAIDVPPVTPSGE